MLPVKSKDLVEEFIASGKTIGNVDVSGTGRTKTCVYAALHSFLKRNTRYGIVVRMHKGEIMLVMNDEQRGIARIH